MFGFFTDAIENTLNVAGKLLDGEAPSQRQIAKLIDAGLSIYAVSELTGYSVDVLNKILKQ